MLFPFAVGRAKKDTYVSSRPVDNMYRDHPTFLQPMDVVPYHVQVIVLVLFTAHEMNNPLSFSAVYTLILRLAVMAGFRAGQTSSLPKFFVVMVLAALVTPTSAETVYDCSGAKTAVATYSLDEINECPDFAHAYRNKTLMRAQILQRSGSQLITGYQCQLTYQRESCYCGAMDARESIFPDNYHLWYAKAQKFMSSNRELCQISSCF